MLKVSIPNRKWTMVELSWYTKEMCLSPIECLAFCQKQGRGGRWLGSGHQLPSADWDKLTEAVTTSDNSWHQMADGESCLEHKISWQNSGNPHLTTVDIRRQNKGLVVSLARCSHQSCQQLTEISWQELATVDCIWRQLTTFQMIWQHKMEVDTIRQHLAVYSKKTNLGAVWQYDSSWVQLTTAQN